MNREAVGRRPQVKLASGRMTLETAVAMGRQIDPEHAAARLPRSVYGAGPAKPMAVAATGYEAQEGQDLLHRHLRSQLGEVNGGHESNGPVAQARQRRGSGNQPVAFRGCFALGRSAAVGMAGCWVR